MLFKNFLKSTAFLLSLVAFAQADVDADCKYIEKGLNKKGFKNYVKDIYCSEDLNHKGLRLAIDGRFVNMKAFEYALSYGKDYIDEVFIKFAFDPLSEKAHENIGKITNLKYLRFIECEYDKIPSQIKNLKNLEELEFNYGEISEIPDFVFNLKNLKSLKINMNKLTKIPEKLSKLEKLEILELYGNKISGEIPESLNKLTNLKTFGVSDNKNIKGKILTNNSLKECYYDENAKLCKPKEVKCAQEYKFKSCN